MLQEHMDIAEKIRTQEAHQDRLYSGSDVSCSLIAEMIYEVDDDFSKDVQIVGSPLMIRQLQRAILHEDGGYAHPSPMEFLGCPLIVDNEIPWWNKLFIFDPDLPEDMMVYNNTMYTPEPPMTDARVAAAQEALQKL